MKRIRHHFIGKENVLENEKRVKILSHIYNNFGCTLSDLNNYGGKSSVSDNVEKLRIYGLIRKKGKMKNVRLYSNFVWIDCLKSYGLDPKYKELFNESKITKDFYENSGRKEAQAGKPLSAEERLILECLKENKYSYVKDISEKTGIDLAEVIYYFGNMGKLVGFEEEKGRKKYFAKQ